MNVLIIVSILCIIIWYCLYETEGFEDQAINPDMEKKYQQFIAFYNPFLVNWEKAIVTSIGLDTSVKPLTNPGDTSTATLQTPSRAEMNAYIVKLGKKLNMQLPLLTDPLPDTLTPAVLSNVTQNISMDPEIYKRALDMMVKGQEEAHAKLEKMKKSPEGFDTMNPYWNTEGFDSCQEYKKCMTDPDVVNAIARAQAQQQSQLQQQQQQEQKKVFELNLDKINSDKMLQSLNNKNNEFLQKAKEIEDKAKNGTLLNEFNLSNNDTSLDHFIKPKGLLDLERLKKYNPSQYAEYEKKNAQIMSVAGLLNSISDTLARK